MGTIKTTFSNNIDATGKLKEGSLGFSAGTSWQSVKTSDFTAVAGEGYFVDTTSGAITVTLPSSPSAGDYVVLKDYARTWATNNVTTNSVLSDGNTNAITFSTNGQTITLVYMDGTKGWSLINEDTTSELIPPPSFISATGGTVTTSGDYKIHTFTGDGCFVVSTTGNAPSIPTGGPSVVDYLVVAGGGGSGTLVEAIGGGGAGGFRESHSTPVSGCYTASPLATPTGITVAVQTYPITVGGGGAGGAGSPTCTPVCSTNVGANGSNSVFATIISAGGGGSTRFKQAGTAGGSGGGGSGRNCTAGGAGNTPPTSPPQGNSGGNARELDAPSGNDAGGGGGGATSAGSPGGTVPSPAGGNGGAGATTSISGSPVIYAGGGGGAGQNAPGGAGGPGGGGDGDSPSTGGTGTVASPGTANRGGGAGGKAQPPGTNQLTPGLAGGSGIVIIRYKYQ